jgi:Uma2 family endonuclease
MWGLEYPLLFGLPSNKLELIEGQTRCAFPFLKREQAEAHFSDWIATLCRWKGLAERPPIRRGTKEWTAEAAGFVLTLAPLPIDLRIPIDGKVFCTFLDTYWRRDLWGGQPHGLESGWEWFQRHHDVKLNLWTLFGTFCKRHGGRHCGGVDVALSDTAAVAPDQYYFAKAREDCMIAGDYFQGPPELIAEVLSPASRHFDRGPRKAVYRRAGVPHLWLLDPELETIELHALTGGDYRLVATHRPGEKFRPALFPETTVEVGPLFQTQWTRLRERVAFSEPELIPEWLALPQTRLGLEYLFLFGHPDRRSEIWGNRAHCVLAFGSPHEARERFPHFLEEAARWEKVPAPTPSPAEGDTEQAEVGRFHLARRGRHVELDVAVDGRKYRDLLRVWARREAWDWGED